MRLPSIENGDLVSAFEVGWAVLHEDVSMFVAEQLLVALSDLRCSDADIQEGLDTLRIELMKQREAGTPWHARDALDVLAGLAGSVLLLRRDLKTRLFGIVGREDRTSGDVQRQQGKADAKNGAEDFVEFEGIHRGRLPQRAAKAAGPA